MGLYGNYIVEPEAGHQNPVNEEIPLVIDGVKSSAVDLNSKKGTFETEDDTVIDLITQEITKLGYTATVL